MKTITTLLLMLLLQACKHPLHIEGEGDIVEVLYGHRGCSLEEFEANSPRCMDNEVNDEHYHVRYEAIAREGSEFVRWTGTACGANPLPNVCEFDIPAQSVGFFDQLFPGFPSPATVAVFTKQPPASGDPQPIVTVAPVYPRRAQSRGIEGYCTVEFTVTTSGSVRDPIAIDCEPAGIFERASLKAVLKFKYEPILVDGEAVDAPGVRWTFNYSLDE